MKRFFGFLFIFGLCYSISEAQELLQKVKGKVTDAVNGAGLAGASVSVAGNGKDFSVTTNDAGAYVIEAPVGRYRITITYTGYVKVQDELLIIAGRQAVYNATLDRGETVLQAVEVTSSSTSPDVPGLQSLSIEKTLRIPANFFDPVRSITAYPAVVAANDQNNSIIVRGNSPNGLLWRLNGLDVVNPNHLSNAGMLSDRPAANGGGVNILSAQMLDRTDFYMGAFPASYGNAVSGIIDMSLREGNKTKNEFTAQASLIGIDLAAEGPIAQNERSSFLANYRYSTVGLLSAIGVNFGDEAITFQDFSFNTSFDQKNGATLSLFGLWGKSKNDFEALTPEEWEEEKEMYDIVYRAQTYALGFNYSVPLQNGKLFLGAAYSSADQSRDADISLEAPPTQRLLMIDRYSSINNILSTSVRYEVKAGDKTSLNIGVMTNYVDNDVQFLREFGCVTCSFRDRTELNGSDGGVLLQPYANVEVDLSSSVELNAGVRYLNYSLNNTSSIEPRVGISFKASETSQFNLAYSLVSQLQLPQVYFAEGNENLGFTKSHHVDFGYNQVLADGLNLRTGLFYQSLFDVPIESIPSSTFSAINLLEGIPPGNLVNEGSGENYGVDATLEKYFFAKNYILVGGSYYESKYTAADGIKRNSRFNGNYTLNAVYGKEWHKESRNRTIGLNTRLLYLGGMRESSVNVPASQSSSETIYDSTDPFSNKLGDYFRVDVRLSFRKNKPGYTRTFAIDIQNLTGQENEAYHYYDVMQQKVITKLQLGLIPVLVYRVDF